MPYITPTPIPDHEEAKQAVIDRRMELAREIMDEEDNGEDQDQVRQEVEDFEDALEMHEAYLEERMW